MVMSKDNQTQKDNRPPIIIMSFPNGGFTAEYRHFSGERGIGIGAFSDANALLAALKNELK